MELLNDIDAVLAEHDDTVGRLAAVWFDEAMAGVRDAIDGGQQVRCGEDCDDDCDWSCGWDTDTSTAARWTPSELLDDEPPRRPMPRLLGMSPVELLTAFSTHLAMSGNVYFQARPSGQGRGVGHVILDEAATVTVHYDGSGPSFTLNLNRPAPRPTVSMQPHPATRPPVVEVDLLHAAMAKGPVAPVLPEPAWRSRTGEGRRAHVAPRRRRDW